MNERKMMHACVEGRSGSAWHTKAPFLTMQLPSPPARRVTVPSEERTGQAGDSAIQRPAEAGQMVSHWGAEGFLLVSVHTIIT